MSISRERCADFFENCSRCRFRVWSTRDRPADHQVIRPGTNRFRRCRYARLIVSLALPSASRTAPGYRADTGNHNQETLSACAPNRPDFVGRRHHAVHAGRVAGWPNDPPSSPHILAEICARKERCRLTSGRVATVDLEAVIRGLMRLGGDSVVRLGGSPGRPVCEVTANVGVTAFSQGDDSEITCPKCQERLPPPS